MTGRATALELTTLVRDFGTKRAVDHLSLSVPAGVLFGLVGPNGAGKTTTLSMATGLLRPTYGSAAVLGHDVWADPARAKALMGVLPDGLRLFDRLTGRELLTYVGRLRRVPEADLTARSEELLATLDLAQDANVLVVDYSAGMTKKIALACALIHTPRLLVLDEPFEAVDPVSGEVIRSILRRYVDGGGTVVLPGRSVLDVLRAEAAEHGWRELFAGAYPHAGGEQHVALFLGDDQGFEVELVATEDTDPPRELLAARHSSMWSR